MKKLISSIVYTVLGSLIISGVVNLLISGPIKEYFRESSIEILEEDLLIYLFFYAFSCLLISIILFTINFNKLENLEQRLINLELKNKNPNELTCKSCDKPFDKSKNSCPHCGTII